MFLNAEEYEQRLEEYSDSTIRLIMEMNNLDEETALKKLEITTDSELTEEQVAEKLLELKASNTRNSPLSPI